MSDAPKPPRTPTHYGDRNDGRRTPPGGVPSFPPRQDDVEDITGRVDLDELEKQSLRNARLRDHEQRLQRHSELIREQERGLADVRGDFKAATAQLESVATQLQRLVDLEDTRQKRDEEDRAAARRSRRDGLMRVLYGALAVFSGGSAHWLMEHLRW